VKRHFNRIRLPLIALMAMGAVWAWLRISIGWDVAWHVIFLGFMAFSFLVADTSLANLLRELAAVGRETAVSVEFGDVVGGAIEPRERKAIKALYVSMALKVATGACAAGISKIEPSREAYAWLLYAAYMCALLSVAVSVWALRTNRSIQQYRNEMSARIRSEKERKRLKQELLAGAEMVVEPGSAAASYGSKPRTIEDLRAPSVA